METQPNKSVSYTGVVLDEKSRNELVAATEGIHGEWGWKTICHHFTLNMGPLNRELNPDLEPGDVIDFKATHLAFDDRVLAVRIACPGARTVNAVPHVTVALDSEGGAKAKYSNDLIEGMFMPLDREIDLRGVVTEVENT